MPDLATSIETLPEIANAATRILHILETMGGAAKLYFHELRNYSV